MTCDDCRLRLQAWLDGDPPGADGIAAHLADCPACRAADATARRLRAGLVAAPVIAAPPGLSDRIVAGVLADRRRQRRDRQRVLFAGLALAAAACLAVAVFLPERAPHESAGARPTGQAVIAEAPRPEEPPAARPSLDEDVVEATSAVASLARRTADQTLTSGQMLIPAVPREVAPREVLPPPLDPPAQSLREAGEGVATGLSPVTNSARRAFDLFLHDLPPVAPEGKAGL
ncbi:MAG TPA: zf-HC2 domain-containing protein [Gemmataceae bacterium]|nr:zf-HC2 domain-containing protein [Gemmataceae bacterium]